MRLHLGGALADWFSHKALVKAAPERHSFDRYLEFRSDCLSKLSTLYPGLRYARSAMNIECTSRRPASIASPSQSSADYA